MWLVDALLARERHTLHSPLPIDECRRHISEEISPSNLRGRYSTPFIGGWLGPNTARVLMPIGRRGAVGRVMFVGLTPDDAGTTVAARTQLFLINVLATFFFAVVFSFVGYAQTSYELTHGHGLLGALFPFGYAAIFLWFLFFSQGPASARQVETYLQMLEYIVSAPPGARASAQSPYKAAFPTTNWSRRHAVGAVTPEPAPPPPPPADLPPPPVSVFVPPPDVPTPRSFTDWLLARRVYTLVTAYSIDECERRVDPARVPTVPFDLERNDSGDFVLNQRWQRRASSVYQMRVRFTRRPYGTQIDVTTEVAPWFLKRTAAWWIAVAALAAVTLTSAWSFVPALPPVIGVLGFYGFQVLPGPIALALLPYLFLSRRASGAGPTRDLVETLERVLGAGPAATSALPTGTQGTDHRPA